jgi:hypothetical protein
MPTTQPVPSPSARPSPFLEQHHIVEPPAINSSEFRQAWRIKTRLSQLLLAGAITIREAEIAFWYRQACERALGNLASNMGRFDTPGRAPYGGRRQEPTARALEAAGYVRHVRAALGPRVSGLIDDCVCNDFSWLAIGKKHGLDRRKAKRLVIRSSSIKRLAKI